MLVNRRPIKIEQIGNMTYNENLTKELLNSTYMSTCWAPGLALKYNEIITGRPTD